MSPIVRGPTRTTTLRGGAIVAQPATCVHGSAKPARPWTGAPGTVGRAVVVGAGKMGLPLAAQFAGHGWDVTAVDVRPDVVDAINGGRSPLIEEPGLEDLVRSSHAEGRLRATLDAGPAVGQADVVVLIVPVMLTDDARPDFTIMDAAVTSILPGVHPGVTVIFETTLPIGETRRRFTPRLEAASGLRADEDFFVAFSPERLFTGAVFRNLATYPKLVGGIGPASGERAAIFYDSVLDAEIVLMSSAEAAEFSKLADTTYRDVNIALANEFAAVAERTGVDIGEVIAAANSQPYSHVHEPGLGVGGHCIPVYPHFLLENAPDLSIVRRSREVNDEAIEFALRVLRDRLGPLTGQPVLVLGITYRAGVRELAYSRALPLIAALREAGANVSAFDPLLSLRDIEETGARAWTWGTPTDARAIVAQTDDPLWQELDEAWFPRLEVLVDGRNALRGTPVEQWRGYTGVGRGDLRARVGSAASR
jgi:nucleotide sugar dehydrogenase